MCIRDSPYIAESFNNLAGLYHNQGRYDDAEPLYLQALDMRKKLLGDEHPDVASSLSNLAGLYHLQGRYDEAEPLYLQTIEISIQSLGEEHPNTQTVLINYLIFLNEKNESKQSKDKY